MKKKIAMVFPYAPSYREPIYKLMDEEFDCTFYFCSNADYGLKYMNYSHLKNVNTEMTETRKGPFMFYSGISKIDFSGYDVVMHPGTIRNLSSWYLNWKMLRLKNRPKLAIWTHGWYGKESKLERIIKCYYYSLIDKIYLYGDYAKKGLIKAGVDPNHLITIYNSLDYDSQVVMRTKLSEQPIYKDHFGNDNPNLFFVGRLTEVKKLDLILRAMALLRERGLYVNMTFIGDGTEKETLESLAIELGLEQNVWFYGACYDEEVLGNMIYNADLCVAPGNIGLTAMHTLAYGTPALTHDDFPFQMPEFEAIREGETGAFFRRGSVESLSEKISQWFIEKDGKRNEVRKACMSEIDKRWTPHVQLEILKKTL